MIFTQQQIEDVLDVIETQHSFFCAHNISPNVLSVEQKALLEKHGIDIGKIKTKFTPYEESFYFGRLSASLQKQAGEVEYGDFKKYLSGDQYKHLTPVQKNTLKYLENRSFHHIKGLENQVKHRIRGILIEANQRGTYEEIIREALKEGVEKWQTSKSVMSKIGRATGDWQRDLGRIAQTELQNAFEYGRYMEIIDAFGDNILMYKQVFPGACNHCVRLYLTAGAGSEPRLFTPQELIENGENIGKKPNEWKAVVGTVHPYCRCLLKHTQKNKTKWNGRLFEYEDDTQAEEKKKDKKIKITVGDKVFEI
jgi:hypothetical protein